MTETDRPTPAEVLDKLAALGSPRQIADHLASLGVRGYRTVADLCPVSVHVTAQTGVRVDIRTTFCDLRKEQRTIPLPDPVARFVSRFDVGDFPELDAARVDHPSRR